MDSMRKLAVEASGEAGAEEHAARGRQGARRRSFGSRARGENLFESTDEH
jgi:hypothetical protein